MVSGRDVAHDEDMPVLKRQGNADKVMGKLERELGILLKCLVSGVLSPMKWVGSCLLWLLWQPWFRLEQHTCTGKGYQHLTSFSFR